MSRQSTRLTTNVSRVASADAIATRIITCPNPSATPSVWATVSENHSPHPRASALPGTLGTSFSNSGTTVFCAWNVIGSTILSAGWPSGSVGSGALLIGSNSRIARSASVRLQLRMQRHHETGHQDAEELADQELPAVHRLAHQRDGGAALDLLADRHARGQHAEQHGREHDHVEPDLLHHLVVVAEREVRDGDRQPDERVGAEHDEPEHRLAARFAVGRERDRPALRPEQARRRAAAAGTGR